MIKFRLCTLILLISIAQVLLAQDPQHSALPINYEHELSYQYTAGGKIVIYNNNGCITAKKQNIPAHSMEEEMRIREENWKLFLKVNTEHEYAAERLTPDQLKLIHQFSHTRYGAIWMRELSNLTIDALKKGYLEINHQCQSTHLSECLTGELTDDGLFAEDFSQFKIVAINGYGAYAEGIRIYLGREGLRDHFASGGQKVDPLAVISHEFGHTILGDYTSGETLQGEGRTVLNYENPIREINGYAPRRCYTRKGRTLVIRTFEVFDHVPKECHLESER